MKERTIKILITAIGGCGPGDQLLKTIKASKRTDFYIVGADSSRDVPQFNDVDQAVFLPRADNDNFIPSLLKHCDKYDIDVVLSGNEAEIKVLDLHREEFKSRNIYLPISSSSVLDVCLDKSKTISFLKDNGFKYPKTIELDTQKSLEKQIDFFPVVLKPAVGGGGSKDIYLAQNLNQLKSILAYLDEVYQVSKFIVQEYVGSSDEEYTVGVLNDINGKFINSIAVKRDLSGILQRRVSQPNITSRNELGSELVVSTGVSHGLIGKFPQVTSQCEKLSLALGSVGTINIQCRMMRGDMYVFEINPRFSGTTSLRAMVGYNEPELLIRQYFFNEQPKVNFEYNEIEIIRTLKENVLTGVNVDHCNPEGRKGNNENERGNIELLWEVGKLPFYYKPLPDMNNPNGLPNLLHFQLIIDKENGLISRNPDSDAIDLLERAYNDGSQITGMMDDEGIGREYAEDFLSYITEQLGLAALTGMSILEIGCGTGYLLSKLKALGADVLGIEPGSQGLKGAEKYDVNIIRDFFPTDQIQGKKFDLVIMYDVLEHMQDPKVCIGTVGGFLKQGGAFVLSVENEEEYLKNGDLSFLFHEHFSYFTQGSLTNVLAQNKFCISNISYSQFGGSLHCVAKLFNDTRGKSVSVEVATKLAADFVTKSKSKSKMIERFIRSIESEGKSLGVYVPGRFINFLTLLDVPVGHIRFFDDNPVLKGTYYPGLPIQVENKNDLKKDPVDVLLIMSEAFGDKIREGVLSILPPQTIIHTWHDVFEAEEL